MAASKRHRGWAGFLFVCYRVLLLYFLFFSEGFGRIQAQHTGYQYDRIPFRYNLTPFKEITRFIRYRHVVGFHAFFVNVFGNIIAFMPMGFFLPAVTGKKLNGMQILVLSFLFSLSVETVQLLTKLGCFDVDDLILNTLGGILGYLIYRVLHGLWMRKQN